MDIKPAPRRPKPPVVPRIDPLKRPGIPAAPVPPQPTVKQNAPDELPAAVGIPTMKPKRKKPLWMLVLAGLLLILVAVGVAAGMWYNWATSAPSTNSDKVRVVGEKGETATDIAGTLYDHGLIRSRLGFNLYAQLSGTRDNLQAGGYVLSPNMNVSSIVEHMTSGKTDEFNITISPGLTLVGLREQFKKYGFSDNEITEAFEKSYDHPLLATRPSGATLEGYIYPETYRQGADQSLDELLERSFDEFYKTLQEKKYLEAFAGKGLTIHQAVTLASIVQKEVKNPTDQKQVAQVFFKRLADNMPLGSDVTFIYAAELTDQQASPSLDSPYNTRKYGGLPPGPIANMNPSALDAVASPAAGDFLYFVAGDGNDEGKTFFARTEEEHNANIAAHCHVLCQ